MNDNESYVVTVLMICITIILVCVILFTGCQEQEKTNRERIKSGWRSIHDSHSYEGPDTAQVRR